MQVRAALAAILAVPVWVVPFGVCEAAPARAALVIDTGTDVLRYCIALEDDGVSGIDMIVLAGEQHGLSYELGYGGQAVCMLAGVGSTSGDCFGEHPDFWGYWRGGDEGWSWSSGGAGTTTVTAGDVEGWAWGSGNDGSTHPAPPPATFSGVCPQADRPPSEPDPQRDRPRTSPAASAPPAAAAAPSVAPSPPDPRPKADRVAAHRGRSRDDRRPQSSPPVRAVAPPASETPPEGGGPVGIAATLVAVVAIAGGGRLLARSRR